MSIVVSTNGACNIYRAIAEGLAHELSPVPNCRWSINIIGGCYTVDLTNNGPESSYLWFFMQPDYIEAIGANYWTFDTIFSYDDPDLILHLNEYVAKTFLRASK